MYMTGNCFNELPVHLFDALVAVHLDQLLLAAIVIEQKNRLAEEDLQPTLDRLAFVVRALIEFAAIDIADTWHFRGFGHDIVDMLMCFAYVAS